MRVELKLEVIYKKTSNVSQMISLQLQNLLTNLKYGNFHEISEFSSL
jgi:hypothetical protein